MSTKVRLFERAKIESPCNADWDSMIGNDQVRFCGHCNLTVNDLSNMTPKAVQRLLGNANGKLCVRYEQRSDSLPIWSTPQLHKIIGRRASRIAAGAFTAALSLSSAVVENAAARQSSRAAVAVISQRAAYSAYLMGPGGLISGTITDPAGTVIAGATVVLSNQDKSVVLATSSNSDGRYRFEFLEPGSYSLTIEAMGFAVAEVSTIYLVQDGEQRIDRMMRTEAEQPERTTGTQRTVVMGAMAVSLPTDPLVLATSKDDIEGVVAALLNGAKVNVRDKATRGTALEHAARNANREMVQLLIRSGADVNLTDGSGQTALMLIGEQATSDLVWDLINAGAKVNISDQDGDTALIEAASSNDSDVVKALLDAGARINHQNNDGETALMKAAESGSVNNVRLMINGGANFNLRNKKGMTALTYARQREHGAIIRMLQSCGADEGVEKKPDDQ